MQSKAATVSAYLESLPPDRREAIDAVRKVILANLDKDLAEGMTYGMIGYFVPHTIYPAGYHCDPRQPLPYAGLASQKGHMSLYLMSLYGAGLPGPATDLQNWFRAAWAKTGKKLDMGKACIRFKKLADLPLDLIGEAIRRVPARTYIDTYEANLAGSGRATTQKPKPSAKPPKAARKPASRTQPSKATKVSKTKASSRKRTAKT